LYSNNKTYRFDELDGWNEDTIKKRLEEISRAEEESRSEEEDV
jgi:hypothetical protein